MTIHERIAEIRGILTQIYGKEICDKLIKVSTYGKHNKIVITVGDNISFIRERRKGRGIQLMRIVNCINSRYGNHDDILQDKTIVIGKDRV